VLEKGWERVRAYPQARKLASLRAGQHSCRRQRSPQLLVSSTCSWGRARVRLRMAESPSFSTFKPAVCIPSIKDIFLYFVTV